MTKPIKHDPPRPPQRHLPLRPEAWGRVGRGDDDDAALLQACIDYAETQPNATVQLAPEKAYGLASTLVIGRGEHPIEFCGPAGGVNGSSPVTLQKLANVLALQILSDANNIHNLHIAGRGYSLPSKNNPEFESTPAILIHAKNRLSNITCTRVGGPSGLGESGTDGYVIGLVQRGEDNLNYTTLENIVISRCAGDGVYIGVNSGTFNTNAINVKLTTYFQSSGYAVNIDKGFRNHVTVQHAEGKPGLLKGVFRINYVENVAECQYAEKGTLIGVDFGAAGARNSVSFQDGTALGTLYSPTLGNNSVRSLQEGKTHLGICTGGHDPSFLGSSVRFDGIRLGSAEIKTVTDGDYGLAFDLLYGSTGGGVEWESRAAKVAQFGKLAHLTLELTGTAKASHSHTARLSFDRTMLPLSMENLGNTAICGQATLVNSEGVRIVHLQFDSVSKFRVLDSSANSMSFKEITGSGRFSLSASFSVQARSW